MTHALIPAGSNVRQFMDAIPAYVFLVSDNLQILDYNRASVEIIGPESRLVLKKLCGEVLRCLNDANSPRGCGTAVPCADCVIRNAVKSAASGDKPYRRQAELLVQCDGYTQAVHFWVTASRYEYDAEEVFIVSLEDVTELVTLRHLLPICSHCKKVRNDEDLWEQIEDYLKKHTTLKFSHGICPDCEQELYSDLQD